MKRSLNRNGPLPVLVAMIVVVLLLVQTVSAWREGGIEPTLAIEVGSSSARMSALAGKNGLVFGTSVNDPKIIWTGPGTHTAPGPLESNWTEDGYLIIKDGTDKSLYVHPFNTLFNRGHPYKMRSQYEFTNRPKITGHQALTLIDITSKYLANLTATANSILGHNVNFVVIVLPDGHNLRTIEKKVIDDEYWGNYTYRDTVSVGDGFDLSWSERRVMNEAVPVQKNRHVIVELYRKTSAAIFPFDNAMEYSRAALVYRVGASAFEASIHTVDAGNYDTLSSVEDKHLGGDDFDRRVMDHLLLAHKNKTGHDLSGDNIFVSRLRTEVEKAKRALSTEDSVWIQVEPSYPEHQGLSEQLSRYQFEELNMDLFNKTIATIDQVIKDSLMYTKDDIQDIIFSGGSSNIPYLQSAIREYFGHHKKYHGLDHPENNVILGAARLGHWHSDPKHYTGDVCCTGVLERKFSIETAGGKMFKLTNESLDSHINKIYTFTTATDNQDRVVIRVFSQEERNTNEHTLEGGIEFTGIAPAPKGIPRIRVRIITHFCGRTLHLNVMDVTSGKTNATIIWPKGRRSRYLQPDENEIEYGMMLERELGLQGGTFELESIDEPAL